MATGDFLINEGTQVIFDDGTNGTVTFDPDLLASADGHVSAPLTITPGLFAWGAKLSFATNPVVGEAVDIYLGLSDGTNDFNISQSSIDFTSSDELKGAMWIGQVVVNTTTAADVFTAFGEVFIPTSQVQVIWWNATADSLTSTAGACAFYLTPIPYNESA